VNKTGIWTATKEAIDDAAAQINCDWFATKSGQANILSPMQVGLDLFTKTSCTEGRMFVFTADGQHEMDIDSILTTIRQMPKNMRVHTVGVGDECDQIMLKELSFEGRGYFTLVNDTEKMKKDAKLSLTRAMH